MSTASPAASAAPTPSEPAAAPPPQAPLWNIANILTIIRCLMVPLFIVLAVLYHGSVPGRFLITAVFVLAMLTDLLDGRLARARNLITDFGKVMDPLADKLMTGAAFVMLSVWDYVPWWMTVLILVREFGITIMRFTILKHGALPATFSGKIKTVVQTVGITFCLLPFELWWAPAKWIGIAIVFVAVVLTVWSGLINLRDGLRLRREALAKGAA